MPTYEYRCRECGHELEAVQAFTDEPLTECPACAGQLRKKFAAPGIAFKGSGFYKNDSRPSSSSSSGTDKTSTPSEKAGAARGASSTETSSGDKAGGSKGNADKGASSPAKPAAPSASPAPKAASTT
jgi:putative FmdB family regulatory protein